MIMFFYRSHIGRAGYVSLRNIKELALNEGKRQAFLVWFFK